MNTQKTNSSAFTPAERWESLKAAIAGGFLATVISAAIALGHWQLSPASPGLPTVAVGSLALAALGISTAIAGFSGALFALTYRYGIRQDTNPQLKGGIVLAFALVRGLAQVDAASAIAQQGWPFAAAVVESLTLFGLTGLGLDWGLRRGWLRSFQG
jgi:hypothetical protein